MKRGSYHERTRHCSLSQSLSHDIQHGTHIPKKLARKRAFYLQHELLPVRLKTNSLQNLTGDLKRSHPLLECLVSSVDTTKLGLQWILRDVDDVCANKRDTPFHGFWRAGLGQLANFAGDDLLRYGSRVPFVVTSPTAASDRSWRHLLRRLRGRLRRLCRADRCRLRLLGQRLLPLRFKHLLLCRLNRCRSSRLFLALLLLLFLALAFDPLGRLSAAALSRLLALQALQLLHPPGFFGFPGRTRLRLTLARFRSRAVASVLLGLLPGALLCLASLLLLCSPARILCDPTHLLFLTPVLLLSSLCRARLYLSQLSFF
mmetsp:Transcript_11307/g.25058  ORF Transcript_11307/g.25058 Transcript_11307/m.25058 type:complete len:316 (-) Transcript_11307:1202-2149(-)